MGVTQSLLKLFGWTSSQPPKGKTGKDASRTASGLDGNMTGDMYDQYTNAIKPPFERRRMYESYDDMDEMTIISSILDAYAEDSTQYDREHKSPVWVTAKKREVREILEDLFMRLNVEDYVESIARDTGKYGDDFGILDIDGDDVVGWDWTDPAIIERIENNEGTLVGFERSDRLSAQVANLQRGEKVQYTWKPWDVIHFRLYKKKRVIRQKYRNIYGTSLLEGAIRIAKQVKILDDMLMVFRLTNTLDKRKYNIDTGNAAVEEEVLILKRWQQHLQRKTYIDPANSRFDSTFNPWSWVQDVFWSNREGSDSSVDVIPGQPNVADIVDVEHFTNKLFGALRAPKGYFGYEGDVNAKATLSAQDMKWGRAVNSLQKSVRNGLTRLCEVQLALKGIDVYDKSNEFSVNMVVPSVLEDLSRLEATQTIIDVAERYASLGETLDLNPSEWRQHIMSAILGMTDEEIERYATSEEPDIDSPDHADKGQAKSDKDTDSGSGNDDEEPPQIGPKTNKDREIIDESTRNFLIRKVGRTTMGSRVTEHARRGELPYDQPKPTYETRLVPFDIVEAAEQDSAEDIPSADSE